MRSACLLACQHTGPRELCTGDCCLVVHFNLDCASTPAWLTAYHSFAWDLGQPGLGRTLDIGTQEWPGGLGYDLGRAAVELLALAQAVPQKQYRSLMAVQPLEPP